MLVIILKHRSGTFIKIKPSLGAVVDTSSAGNITPTVVAEGLVTTPSGTRLRAVAEGNSPFHTNADVCRLGDHTIRHQFKGISPFHRTSHLHPTEVSLWFLLVLKKHGYAWPWCLPWLVVEMVPCSRPTPWWIETQAGDILLSAFHLNGRYISLITAL